MGNRESPWASAWTLTLEDWTTSLTAPLTLLRVSSAPPGLPPADWAVGASPRPGKHLEETEVGDLFDGPLSPPARSPRSLDSPHSPAPPRPSAIDAQPVMCLPGSQISPAHLYYPVLAPWIRAGSLTSSRPPGRRESEPLRVPPRFMQAELILRLRALGLPLLVLLLVLLQPVRAQNPKARDVSMGVVS